MRGEGNGSSKGIKRRMGECKEREREREPAVRSAEL